MTWRSTASAKAGFAWLPAGRWIVAAIRLPSSMKVSWKSGSLMGKKPKAEAWPLSVLNEVRREDDALRVIPPTWTRIHLGALRGADVQVSGQLRKGEAFRSSTGVDVGFNAELESHIAQFRSTLVDRVLGGVFLVALVGVPASLLRAIDTDWLRLYDAHLVIGSFAVAAFLFRQRLSTGLKSTIVLALFWAVGVVGLYQLGLYGAGIWWLVVSTLVGSTLFSRRFGWLLFGAVFMVIVVAGWAFTSGIVQPVVDGNLYVRSASSWATILVGIILMPLIVFEAVAQLQAMTRNLLREVYRQRELVRELAYHDELTGLPRANLAMDRLEQGIRGLKYSGRRLALLFIDLDGFKEINDSYGHEVGDEVLAEVARRMQASVGSGDTIARLGGDEFIVIIPSIECDEDALRVGQSLMAVFDRPVQYREHRMRIGASIGISITSDDAEDARSLLSCSDRAMYQAKKRGKGRIVQLQRCDDGQEAARALSEGGVDRAAFADVEAMPPLSS